MKQELELFLEPDGFYAGRKLKNGKLGAGAHKITEEEITIMFTTLARAFMAKTGKDTMVMAGEDGKAVIAKVVPLKTDGDGIKK